MPTFNVPPPPPLISHIKQNTSVVHEKPTISRSNDFS